MPDPASPTLVNLNVTPHRAAELRAASRVWPSWTLTGRQQGDLELLVTGGFSPLSGFMTRTEYEAVCTSMRLPDGRLWPSPVTLAVRPDVASAADSSGAVALRDSEGRMLAALHVHDIWQREDDLAGERIDRRVESSDTSVDDREPSHAVCVGGRIEAIESPLHYSHRALRLTPAEVRTRLAAVGWTRVMGVVADNPMHRAEGELVRQELEEREARLLVLAIAMQTTPGALKQYTHVRCLQSIIGDLSPRGALMTLIPLANQFAGVRGMLYRALVARNFGCTDVLLGQGDDGSSQMTIEPSGDDDTGSIDSGVLRYEQEAGIRIASVKPMVFVSADARYRRQADVPLSAGILRLSNAEFERRLAAGEPLPPWFTYPTVASEIQRAHPPRARQGFTVFFTGLSGSGKSTVANMLLVRLVEIGGRPVSLLDGDIVRRHLTSELGFSREHRDLNIQRIAFVASEITRCGGVALCAAIAPYNTARHRARRMIEAAGGFLLVHTAAPIDVCEQRDVKGLYAKARDGMIPNFTGVSAPYEAPADADLVLDTSRLKPEDASEMVVNRLIELGYLHATSLSPATLTPLVQNVTGP